ncbi:MAG TPA: hypothetical protein VER26_11445 [Xanthobacteraceae bacterium]|nr:hypothetical protein [Xanthobacteraceae bacterium]HYQ07575.1 hypothetical protein [Xanthobacteraceae bacterium]
MFARLEIAAIATEKNRMGRGVFSGVWRNAAAAGLAAIAGLLSLPSPSLAQVRNLVGPQSVTAPAAAPATGSPGATLVPPTPVTPPALPPVAQAAPGIPAGHVQLAVAARYGQNAPAINAGLIWRVYAAKPDAPGNFRLIKEDRGATPTFALPPGNYVVHASLGLASAAKTIQLRGDTVREMFDIPAGGIRLEGRVGDVRIPLGQISFEIFTGSQFDTSERRPIAQNVQTGDVVLLPEGTYYIVSNYGDGNSVVRSDVHIEPGKLTDIVVTHRAAIKTLKLVNNPGGEALANTQWTVLTPGGDVIKESIGAFPRLVLAEGDYHVIARNEGRTYQRDFKVITGVDGEVEVVGR